MNTIRRLGQSIEQGDIELVKELILKNPYLLAGRTESGVTPLLLAVYRGQDEIVRFILDQDCQLDLFEAAAVGRSLRLAEILDSEPELANAFAPDGFTPLGLAAYFGHQTTCEILLTRGADACLPANNSSSVQPLHSAAASRQVAIAELLLRSGADPDARQQGGFTPLHAAAQNGQVEMMTLLLRHGADRDLRSDDGKTAFDFARESRNPAALRLLTGPERAPDQL